MKRTAVALLVLAGALGLTTQPAHAEAARPEPVRQHCSIDIVGQLPTGELQTTAPRCFATQAEVRSQSLAAVQNVLAIHYKQTGYAGPSLTINGSSCTGGYVNFSGALASWRNAVVSTRNVFCPVTRHWSGFNKTGAVDYHGPWEVNLGSLVGSVSSASYHNS